MNAVAIGPGASAFAVSPGGSSRRNRFGQRDHRRFRRDVRTHVRQWPGSADPRARQGHDAAVAARPHGRQHGAHHCCGARDVDGEDVGPLGRIAGIDRAERAEDARVRDRDVDRAEPIERVAYERADCGRISHVTRPDQELGAGGSEIGGEAGQVGFGARAARDDASTGGREPGRDVASDPAPRARDERDPTVHGRHDRSGPRAGCGRGLVALGSGRVVVDEQPFIREQIVDGAFDRFPDREAGRPSVRGACAARPGR